MLRIAICDDEGCIVAHIEELLKEYKKEPLVTDAYGSGEELLAALFQEGREYDLILLDVDMQGMDGIETARRIRKWDKRVKLIYITNYSDYTIFAFAVHAFAYLLKPVNKQELFAQLDEVRIYGEREPERELEFITKEGIIHLKPSQITCFEYQDRNVLICTKDSVWHQKGKIMEAAERMKEYDFVMPHKSFVVNLYAVQSIRGYDINLTDGRVIPLSQKKSAEFRRLLNRYLAGERRKKG